MSSKVLVVEDEPILLETLAYNLNKQGYQVLTADDGHQAIALARKERPALLVLDLMLPGVDGFEVCRVLRQEMTMPILEFGVTKGMFTSPHSKITEDYITGRFG